MAAVRDPHWWEATIQVVRAARSPGADAIPTNRGRPADPPQRIGGRCGSRASPDATGTSPTPSAPDEVTGDRKTNGSVPRQSRREAEPQRGLTGWAAALSRHTGVSRDQPLEASRVQRREAGRMHSFSGGWSRLATPRTQPGQRSGVNGPGPPRSAGGVEPEGIPLGGAWRSQAPPVKGPKSVVQTRSWPRGAASAGCRRSRRPAVPGHGPVLRPATAWRRSVYRLIHR